MSFGRPISAASPDPSESSIRPTRPTLEPEGEILSTRGQRLASLIRRRSISSQDDFFRPDESAPWERALRLIGDSRPIYNWQHYWRDPSTLKGMQQDVREYYERNNNLISQYVFIDRLLDSSLPHRLIDDYSHARLDASAPDTENVPNGRGQERGSYGAIDTSPTQKAAGKVKRTPRNLYRIPSESSLLLSPLTDEGAPSPDILPTDDGFVDSSDRIVTIAIYVNFVANITLLVAKIVVMTMTNSLSVLASLVDGALDFLSTVIVWVTTTLTSKENKYQYPISRRRLEPLSVLVFSVVMMTSFVQVAITSISRLMSPDHTIVYLSVPSIAVMASTVVIKLLCWFWCRLIKNSSVQALAQDAMTDVVFNLFSILFPLVGSFTHTWWVDPLGGLLLSVYIIWNWGGTAAEHIRHLTGAAATSDEHSILIYMTMRFSKSILNIQGLKAYYAGDLLNVEVDIILEEKTSLRDSHDVGESLQYMIESVPTVDRAFVHLDYDPWNPIPTHMNQREN
ncbi:hypothetical protein FE257_012437 [Aspergillus nanangensis]|uniref:Cation efflux protein transmembrane domain-containing protein n=1 Tax=Aspergillus nanangensis TaxID=2582783 RepID=A0AAD4CUM6_ASPNN|nr:hypothetical protein FE257_012437 [Aspergillus nanangensis]